MAGATMVGDGGRGGHGTGDACLNCGTALAGAYCHVCGQGAHLHRTLRSIGHDVLHGAFHFEGRILHTLPLLLRDPGGLTRRYIAGERVRFVPPLALFLFCVFLMFAAIHAVEPEAGDAARPRVAASAQRMRTLGEAIVRERAELSRARALPPTDPDRDHAEASARARLSTLRRARAEGGGDDLRDVLAHVPDHLTGWARLDHGIAHVRDNPALAFYQFQGSAYKYSWALILISTPFVALMFAWRRRFTMFDHAVFVTYSLDFMLLLATTLTLGGAAGMPGWITALVLLLVPPAHMFVQLRGAYGLRRPSALWRTVALIVFAWTALAIFLALLVAQGLIG